MVSLLNRRLPLDEGRPDTMGAMVHQDAVFKAMVHAGSYPHPVRSIQVVETHISKVFLTGTRVYKIKKAVDLGFLDFTALADRYRYCIQELNLNRRLSHGVYLEVVPITSDGSQIGVKRGGQVVEYALCMRQLNADQSMAHLLRTGKFNKAEIPRIAELLQRFYSTAPRDAEVAPWGDVEVIARNCAENFDLLERFTDQIIDGDRLRAVKTAVERLIEHRRALFAGRKRDGFIREGHGDLRCAHVYIEEEIQIIDCIEFDSRYRCGDTASDIAFLAMDLDFEGYHGTARQLVETYARLAQDPQLLLLIDFYKCYRAAVRAKINCLRLQNNCLPLGERNTIIREVRRYLDLAVAYALAFSQPTVWVVCGLPASGKSTLAEGLGDLLGCTVASSDIARKTIFGLPPESSAQARFGDGIYTPVADARTYARLFLQAEEALSAGESIILDATFSREDQRSEAIRLADDRGANICFVECRAPAEVIEQRLAHRAASPGISDARVSHLAEFRSRYEPFEEMEPALHQTADTTLPTREILPALLAHEAAVRAENAQKKMIRGL